MHNKQIEYLEWDSAFFKKKIGKIFMNDSLLLKNILSNSINNYYELIYVFTNKDDYINDYILKQFNGFLADRKILYEKELKEIKEFPSIVTEYDDTILTPELEQLAYISGEYSRFKLDKNFSKDDFYRMYKIWIEKSIKKQIADKVYIIRRGFSIKGMVTLKMDNEKGRIGLIAVLPESQGKGYGIALINACEQELLKNSIYKLDVFTQGNNIPACKFYTKNGFLVKEITNVYHFWRRQYDPI